MSFGPARRRRRDTAHLLSHPDVPSCVRILVSHRQHKTRLPFVIGQSRSASRIIRQDLWVSLDRVAMPVPATLFGRQLGAAVLFHEGSSLLVVANALRLLAYRDPTEG